MNLRVGGTGHVGSAVGSLLPERGDPVTIVSHDPAHADKWRARGALVALCDVHDVAALGAVLAGGRRALLIRPPAGPSTDNPIRSATTLGRYIVTVVSAAGEGTRR